MNVRILDYDEVINELEKIGCNQYFSKQDFYDTEFDNIKIPYYIYGKGDNHIIVVGGTHGSEIISVDFVLRLMEDLAFTKRFYDDFTFHFIPLLNPEGYIISTSMIKGILNKNASEKEIIDASLKYYLRYKKDDELSKNYNSIKNIKLHQQMFDNTSYKNIPDKYLNLKENVRKICENNKEIPMGSLVVWRGNGLGIETNRDNKYVQWLDLVKSGVKKYGSNRYNNIPDLVEGPLGKICVDLNDLDKHTKENTFLLNLIKKIYDSGKYAGMYIYHGTGGEIFYKICPDLIGEVIDINNASKYVQINKKIALNYSENTKYKTKKFEKNGYKLVENPNLIGMDELLRAMYPAVLLIELSYMGGNPLGPYADKDNNYIPTIEYNIKAFYSSIIINKSLKNEYKDLFNKKTK